MSKPTVFPLPRSATSETSPVALFGVRVTCTGTEEPWVMFTALLLFRISDTVVATRLTVFQLFARLDALMEPKPVAKS